jgi:hypothetical protein
MSQEQARVSKTDAARRASRHRARNGDGDEPESAFWQEAVPWYQGQPRDDGPEDEDTGGEDDE